MNYMEIVSRPKLNQLGWHFGIRQSNGICYDFQPSGMRVISDIEFASGFEIQKGTRILETKEANKRLNEIIHKNVKYDFFNFNCENFARYLVEGKSESHQINFLAFAFVFFGAVWITSEA